jgi:hypothetical protein
MNDESNVKVTDAADYVKNTRWSEVSDVLDTVGLCLNPVVWLFCKGVKRFRAEHTNRPPPVAPPLPMDNVHRAQAIQWVRAHRDGDAVDVAELESAFRALFNREPDAPDRMWSQLCDAVASERSARMQMAGLLVIGCALAGAMIVGLMYVGILR